MRKGIRALRRELEFTLDALSDQSGVDRAAIHRIENIEKYPEYEPGLDTFRRLIEGLGITLQAFFDRFPKRPQPDSGMFRETSSTAGADQSSSRAFRLLETMSDEGQREAAGVLAILARAYPRELPQESAAPVAKKRAATVRKVRGRQ